MSVGLTVVTVFVLVLDVLMIVLNVRVGVRHVLVRVLMGVLRCGHRIYPVLDGDRSRVAAVRIG
jgi:hypothetical protein